MMKVYINRFACAVLLTVFCISSHAAIAQQAKPVAAKAASKTDPSCAAACAKKSPSCCKGTPTRAAVLAANNLKIKPVKK